MKNGLRLYYDEETDFLEFNIGKLRKGFFQDIGNDIFERIDAETKEIKGFAILNFAKRFSKPIATESIPLPVNLNLIPIKKKIVAK